MNDWKMLRISRNIKLMARSAIIKYSRLSETIGREKRIVIIPFLVNTKNFKKKADLYCDFYNFDNTILSKKGKIRFLKRSYRFAVSGIQEYILECPVSEDNVKLEKVNLRCKNRFVQFKLKFTYTQPKNLTICLPPLYGYFDENMLIEWFEYYKWLGVDSIFIYPWKISKPVENVLKFYAKENFAVVQNLFTPVSTDYNWKENTIFTNSKPLLIKVIMPMYLNECFLMNSERSKFILSIDFDEFIILKKDKNLLSLVKRYQDENCYSQIEFGQLKYDVSCKRVNNHTSFFFSHAFRESFKNFRYEASKSIINPKYCRYISNHRCQYELYTDTNKKFTNCKVQLKDGYFGHFRKMTKCHKERINKFVEDKFNKNLEKELQPIFKKIKFNYQMFKIFNKN